MNRREFAGLAGLAAVSPREAFGNVPVQEADSRIVIYPEFAIRLGETFHSVSARETMRSHLSALLGAALCATVAASPAWGQRGFTGTTDVPGSNQDVNYEVTVKKNPGTTNVSFTLTVENTDSTQGAFSFIACAMLQLDKPHIDMPSYVLRRSGASWTWERDGTASRPPGVHFGCKTVTVPANGGRVEVWTTTVDLGIDFEEDDFKSVYWDLLESSPIRPEAEDLAGRQVNLGPSVGELTDIIGRSVNVWGARSIGCSGEPLTAPQPEPENACAPSRADIGNWVTMAEEREYAARLTGSISGAPENTAFTLTLPGVTTELVAGPAGTVQLDVPFRIPVSMDALQTLQMIPSGVAQEGTLIRLDADVVSGAGNAYYEPGQFMYSVDQSFIWDSESPTFGQNRAMVDAESGVVRVEVSASDVTSRVAAATVRYAVDEGPQQADALGFARPAFVGDATRFVGEIMVPEGATTVVYEVVVVDQAGNETVSETRALHLGTQGPSNLVELLIALFVGLAIGALLGTRLLGRGPHSEA